MVPSLEEALFGEYCMQGNFHHKDIASIIFQDKLSKTTEKLLPWLSLIMDKPKEQLHYIIYLCSKLSIKLTDYFKTREIIHYEEEITPAWTSLFFPNNSLESYTLWATVWIRVNCSNAFGRKNPKIQAFLNAHLPVIRYLDTLKDPKDENIDKEKFESLYKGIGKTMFDTDRNYIKTQTNVTQIRLYPLQIILKYYPKLPWFPEQVGDLKESEIKHIRDSGYDIKPKEWQSYQYYACLYIMVQCKDLYELNEYKNNELLDGL